MADSIDHFTLESSTDNVTTADQVTHWQMLNSNISGSLRSFDDSQIPNPKLWYRLTGYSVNGVVIPYNIVGIAVNNGGMLKFVKIASAGFISSAQIKAVASDSSGNIYIAGVGQNSVNPGGGNISLQGNSGVFVAKFRSDGTFVWQMKIDGLGDDSVYSLAVDSAGMLIVGGGFQATVDFGGTSLTATANPVFGTFIADGYIAKYDPTGTSPVLLWVKQFGGTSADLIKALATDNSNNIYAALQFQSASVTIGASTYNNFSAGTDDIALIKLDSSGAVGMSAHYGGTNSDIVNGIDVDRHTGDVVMCGQVYGASAPITTNLGGGTVSANGTALFVAKYDGTNLNYKWAKYLSSSTSVSNTQGDQARSVAIDQSNTTTQGRIFITGRILNALDFGLGPTQSGGVFLAAYDTGGAPAFSKTFNSLTIPADPTDISNSIAWFNGVVAIAGSLQNSNSLGVGYFCATFTPDGTLRWTRNAAISQGSGSARGSAAGFNIANGDTLGAGDFSGTGVDFGNGVGQSTTANAAGFTCDYVT
jgi:hypothetical protein